MARNMQYNRFKIQPLTPAVGAEILDVDVKSIDDDTLADVMTAFAEFGVIFFRDQELTEAQHIAFAERIGTININRFFSRVDGYPMIAEVLKEATDKRNIGSSWHSDHSYDKQPAMGSILYAKQIPPIGGDTLFASMNQAYENLSNGLKRTLHGLRAIHSSAQAFSADVLEGDEEAQRKFHNPGLATQETSHPMIITHPLSGRKSLFVNPDFTVRIDGWSKQESAPLLNYLYKYSVQPAFSCRFRWQKNSIAFWDNRAVWHSALNDYHGYRRLMHRITLNGCDLTN